MAGWNDRFTLHSFYKEELIFRANMVERNIRAIIKMFSKRLSRLPSTTLVRSENAKGEISLSIRTGNESLHFFFGIDQHADELVGLIRNAILDAFRKQVKIYSPSRRVI